MEIRSLKTYAAMLLSATLFSQGCAHGIITHNSNMMRNAIPAHRLPDALASMSKENLVPIDFTRLRRDPVNQHTIGPSDILGIYIQDVLAVENQLPAVFYPTELPTSLVRSPSIGHPIAVHSDGAVALPLIGRVQVAGLTIPEAVEAIRKLYLEKSILKEGRQLVTVDLIRPRTIKVFVVREDTGPLNPALIRGDTQVFSKRGTADALDLPIFENDVLHALSVTGGLPGVDGFNEIWILRGSTMSVSHRSELMSKLQAGELQEEQLSGSTEFVRIPLRVCPGQPIPFSPRDVILHDGDVVFIESRDIEYFTTGGLIRGGIFPLPRDRDLDILEAIAIANTSINGPSGNAVATNFRSGPGNIVAPTNALLVRKLDNGEQIKILVDLRIAMTDANERINVMPRDLIILRYKPGELLANIALNFVNFNYAISNNN